MAESPLPVEEAARRAVQNSALMCEILDCLFRRPGDIVSAEEIASHAYRRQRRGGPNWARSSVAQTIWRNRKRLEPLGVKIRGYGGPGGGYCLSVGG